MIFIFTSHRLQAGERDIPFLACWCSPKPQMQIFLKFAKRLRRGFLFFWNVIFIVLYINFTVKNKSTFDKIFNPKISYILKILQKNLLKLTLQNRKFKKFFSSLFNTIK